MAEIRSVSLNKEQAQFLEDNKNIISLSSLTQAKINEMIEFQKPSFAEIKSLRENMFSLQKVIEEKNEKIEELERRLENA